MTKVSTKKTNIQSKQKSIVQEPNKTKFEVIKEAKQVIKDNSNGDLITLDDPRIEQLDIGKKKDRKKIVLAIMKGILDII